MTDLRGAGDVAELDELMQRFRALAVQQRDRLGLPDDVAHSHRIAALGAKVVAAFLAHGEAGIDRLEALLADPNPWVRLEAASCLLDHRTDHAAAVLLDLARGGNASVNITADVRYMMWHYDTKGDLPDDWKDDDTA